MSSSMLSVAVFPSNRNWQTFSVTGISTPT